MNGAIAEPLASTRSPPSSSITITIGASQYFLRTRMKRHNSAIRLMGGLELVLERFGRRSRRRALDPVCPGRFVEAQAQRVLAERTHEQPHRGDHAEEHDAEHDRAHDPMQQ